jgi:predicted transcriptional regulator
LECLWSKGPANPGAVHEFIQPERRINVNTVSSAMKRLYEKGLLSREKVSHAYVYTAAVTRGELQWQLIDAITEQFGGDDRSGFLAAFVEHAAEGGLPVLRRLEALIAARLGGDE